MQIETLVAQHKHMLQIVDRVAGLRPEKDAEAIARELAALRASLAGHLAVEDRDLYPALRSFGEQPGAPLGLKMNIKNFFDEMEALKPVAEAFLVRWTAGVIQASPQAFREEFSGLADTLGQRIAREESRLYPLFSQLVVSAQA